ncbi:MAG: hypothetical protein M1369_00630 [Deinococcus sp.]|nr:hypothetical protein [Deinococcus sp.]
MAAVSLALKLPSQGLSRVKAAEVEPLTLLNTELASRIPSLPKQKGRKLIPRHFQDVKLESARVNQTPCNVNRARKVKRCKRLSLEAGNQNWELHKVGDTVKANRYPLEGY